MRKIVSGLLMGLLFVGCAKQETTASAFKSRKTVSARRRVLFSKVFL